MKLTPLFRIQAQIGTSNSVGRGPLGVRSIAEVIGGSFEGERLKGVILTPGADWVLFDDAGMGHVDVRLTLKTDDGVHIYMRYVGVLEFNERTRRAMAEGGETEFGDTYFVTQPRFETGDERYAWLNYTVAVAEGRMIPGPINFLYSSSVPQC